MIKYCLPIIKNTKKKVLKLLSTKGYDCYEVWLDYIKDLDDKFIADTAKKYQSKLIVLFRRQNLEKIKLPIQRRQELIKILSKYPVLIDLDFLTQHEELETITKVKTRSKLILSFHNYKQTHSLDYLQNLISKMRRFNPDIFKITTFCQKESDNFILLNLLLSLKEQKLKYIILGMGKNGLMARIFGAFWGNAINFAPKKLSEKSASGQLTKKSLELILGEIN